MARPGSPEGKWVTVPVRLREAHVKRIDAIVGEGGNRSEWLRQAALIALTGRDAGVSARAPAGKPLEPKPPPADLAAGVIGDLSEDEAGAFVDAVSEGRDASPPPAVAPEPRRCTHQGTRVIGGWCSQCQSQVAPGGKLVAR